MPETARFSPGFGVMPMFGTPEKRDQIFTVLRRSVDVLFAAMFIYLCYLSVSLHNEVIGLRLALHKLATSVNTGKTFRLGELLGPLPVRSMTGREFLLNPRLSSKD